MNRSKEKRVQRRERRRAQTRSEIIDVAREMLLQSGVSGLTIDAVAKELELTKPAIYYYFKNKQALVLELVITLLEDEVAAVESAVASTDGARTAVEALMRAFFTHYASRMPTFRLIYLQMQILGPQLFGLTPDQLERMRPLNDRIYGRVEALIGAAQRRGELTPRIHPRQAAVAAHTAVIGLLTYKGLAESAGDPLRHSDTQMLDTLCTLHTAIFDGEP